MTGLGHTLTGRLVATTSEHKPALSASEQKRRAELYPELLALLTWCAKNEGECLGDHPHILAAIKRLTLTTP